MKNGTKTANAFIPAAQYIRMSTEHQRFSPDNQRAANLAYAAANGYEIVATYQDSGKSGLTLKARPELKRLLSDVLSGTMPYRTILVLDVSRWGRFQDADQAAHYEYMCREAGIPVRYCSEAFDNDGGAMASIVKHMKRVMAAQYSVDLAAKVARAQRLQASMGYKQGGDPAYATRRQVVDIDGKPRMILARGQRKALTTDRIVFVRGPASEVALVRRIFQLYAAQGKSIAQIRAWLEKRGEIGATGRAWSVAMLRRLLTNEIYVGTYVFGRQSNNLGKKSFNPEDKWVRSVVLPPIINPDLFRAAVERMARSARRHWPDDELKQGLSRLLDETGYLSKPVIDDCAYLPKLYVITKRFGTLENACRLVGYEKPLRASSRHKRLYSDQDLIDILRRIHAERGRISHTIIDADEDSPKSNFFAIRLGGFRNAYHLAGIIQGRLPRESAPAGYDRRTMTKARMIEGLQALLATHGYVSTKLIDDEPSIPCSASYSTKFGSLICAYQLAGFCETRSDVMKAVCARRKPASEMHVS